MAQVKSVVLQQWKSHKKDWKTCTRCEIGRLASKHVFGRGQLPCDVLFIGEGPGKSEDALGEPFVGLSGRILDSWIEAVIGKTDIRWAVTNMVACRPTDRLGGPNRAPTWDEICNCSSRLVHFVREIARPMAFILLGNVAEKNLSEQTFPGIRQYKLYHPSYVARKGGIGSDASKEEIKKLRIVIKEIQHARQGA